MTTKAEATADPVDRLLDRLDGVVRSGNAWKALCPAHDDHTPSLSVGRADTGAALVRCQVGCETADVLDTVGLRMGDLYPDGRNRPRDQWRVADRPVTGPSRPPLAAVDGSSPGKHEAPRAQLGRVVSRYRYCDESGTVLFEKLRHDPKDFRVRRPGGAWGIGDARRVLYRLPEVLAQAQAGGTVYVVEGEKDADRLAEMGLTATCNFDGAATAGKRPKWRPEYGDTLSGADVVIIRDRDDAGAAHALAAHDDLIGKAAGVRIVEPVTTGEHDDVSDHLNAGHPLDALVPVDVDALRPPAAADPADTPGPASSNESVTETIRTGWERADLAAILDGTYQPPVPGILYRSDGPGLFYPGLLHQVIGQPESGKSWLSLLACAARLADGERVLFLDYESDPAQVVGRLLAIGATRDTVLRLFDYRRPEVGVDQVAGTFAELLADDYALVVVDGVTDAIGLHGGSISDNDDAGAWLRAVPERIARETGAAVVLVDHVAKGGNGSPSRYAVGAQQKLGKVRGVSYYVEPRTPIAPGQVGELAVIGTKDTAGQVKRHGVPLDREPRLWAAARVRVDATDPDHLDVQIRPPFDVEAAEALSDVGERGALYERNPVLMERVSRVLETAQDEMSGRSVTDTVKGNQGQVKRALQALVREGHVTRRQVGMAQLHSSEIAFREAEHIFPPEPGTTPDLSGVVASPTVSVDASDGVGDPLAEAATGDLQ